MWFLLSFQRVSPGDPELQQAQIDASTVLPGVTYRFDIFRIDPPNSSQPSLTSFRRKLLPVHDRRLLFVDPEHRLVLLRRSAQALWNRAIVNV